jgi:hypothetical protein
VWVILETFGEDAVRAQKYIGNNINKAGGQVETETALLVFRIIQ